MLDLCAAPGGKTSHLAQLMQNEGVLFANDVNPKRLVALSANLQRLGVANCVITCMDGRQYSSTARGFHKILLDAPCSGTGTWRRNPESRWRMSEKAIARYVQTQAKLLEIAAPLVKPGGYLVYIVCSLLAQEGEGQISNFLQSCSDFRKDGPASTAGTAAGDGYVLTPARNETDGFFFARLQRSC